MNKTILFDNVYFKCFTQIKKASWKSEKNFYEVLGVPKNATIKDIKLAYYKKCKEHHPDNNKSDPKSHEKFISINKAYSTLSEKNARNSYDESLLYRRPPSNFTNNRYSHPYPHARNNWQWQESEYERFYRRYNHENGQEFKNENNQTNKKVDTFNSPFFAMLGLIFTLAAFEIWTISRIYEYDMNNLTNNEPSPFNRHVISEFKRKIDTSNFPAEHEAEIDALISKSKQGIKFNPKS